MLQQLISHQQTPQNSHPCYTGGWLTRERRATLPPCVPFWVLETHHTILCFGAFTLAVTSASFAFSMKRTPWFSKATQKCPLSSPSCPVNSGLGTPLSYLTTSCTHSFHSTEHLFFFLLSLVAHRTLGILLVIATLATNRTQYTKIRLSICRPEKHLLTKHFPELHLRSTRGS